MLKGHVQIDLHNHNSGSNERIEQDNLITNAAQLMTNALVGRAKSVTNIMPLCSTLLGGVMLFKDELYSNVNNYLFPGNNLLVGFAGQVLNTEDHQLGSLNVNETGPTEDGFETVWEFTTTQSNGYISSLALTNSKVANPSMIPQIALVDDVLNYGGYTHAGTYRDYNTGTMTYKNQAGNKCHRRIPTEFYKIDDTYNYVGAEEIESTTYSDISLDDMSGTRFDIQVSFVQPSGQTYYILNTVNMTNLTTGTSKIFDLKSLNLRVYEAYDPSSLYTTTGRKVTVSNGHAFLAFSTATTGSAKVVICHFSDLTYDVVTINDEDMNAGPSTDVYICPLKGGGAMLYTRRVSGSERMAAQITSTGDYKVFSRKITYDTGYYSAMWFDDLTFLRGTGILSLPAGYLGSIANLEQPFEKTNTVSMKVKYILTQV